MSSFTSLFALLSLIVLVHGIRPQLFGLIEEFASGVTIPDFQYFNQSVDHFNLQDDRTFSQRYVVNDTYWDGIGPVFFMVSSGALNRNVVVTFQMALWAQQFKALLVAVEHRYFGLSNPFDDLSTESLQFFSVDQVLADYAAFTSVINQQYQAQNKQWIVFGGSYGGMLASWTRVKYPHLFSAVVASSATVQTQSDYYQYLEVVAKVLANPKLGGSAKCVKNIAAATAIIEPLTQTDPGKAQLSKLFNTCTPVIDEDIPNFMQYFAYNFNVVVQRNLINQGTNVTTVCDMLTDPSKDVLTKYIGVWNFLTGADTSCVDVSLAGYMRDLNNTVIPGSGRQTYYLFCFIQGFFQSSGSNKQPFGSLFPVDTLSSNCPLVFDGIQFNNDRIEWTNLVYGGNKPQVSDVLYVNGDVDPWYPSSILKTPPKAEYDTLFIKGTTHCADMYSPKAWSPKTLAPAQEKIRRQLKDWIKKYNKKH